MRFLNTTLQIVPIGTTNSGKTTFINSLVGSSSLLNTSEMRETSCLWKIQFLSNPGEAEQEKYRFNVFTIDRDMKSKKDPVEKQPKNKKELRDLIKSYSEKVRKDKEVKLIDKIVITMPQALQGQLFAQIGEKSDIGNF